MYNTNPSTIFKFGGECNSAALLHSLFIFIPKWRNDVFWNRIVNFALIMQTIAFWKMANRFDLLLAHFTISVRCPKHGNKNYERWERPVWTQSLRMYRHEWRNYSHLNISLSLSLPLTCHCKDMSNGHCIIQSRTLTYGMAWVTLNVSFDWLPKRTCSLFCVRDHTFAPKETW